jgi:hypothetical protein
VRGAAPDSAAHPAELRIELRRRNGKNAVRDRRPAVLILAVLFLRSVSIVVLTMNPRLEAESTKT